jgi:hypothetical protein
MGHFLARSARHKGSGHKRARVFGLFLIIITKSNLAAFNLFQ